MVKEANALHSAGYHVTVVTNGAMSFLRELDKEMGLAAAWNVSRTDPTLHDRISRRFWLEIARRRISLGMTIPHSTAVRAFSAQTSTLTQLAVAIRADLYIAHYVAALPAAAAAAKSHGALLGFDAEDFHLGESTVASGIDVEAELVRTLSNAYLRRCVHLTAASPLIADAYPASAQSVQRWS